MYHDVKISLSGQWPEKVLDAIRGLEWRIFERIGFAVGREFPGENNPIRNCHLETNVAAACIAHYDG